MSLFFILVDWYMIILKYLGIALIIGLVISSCRKDDYYTGSDVVLRFSVDTLTFDTVFTEVGSATRVLKVYNDNETTCII